MNNKRSPIVTESNFPSQAKPLKTNPKKSELNATLLTEAQLLEEMRLAGGKKLNTHQFALLIAPFIKESKDWAAHCNWDQAHGYIRGLMRKLAKKGLVEMKLNPSTKKRVYIYNLNKCCFAPTFKKSYVELFGEEAYQELKEATGATENE